MLKWLSTIILSFGLVQKQILRKQKSSKSAVVILEAPVFRDDCFGSVMQICNKFNNEFHLREKKTLRLCMYIPA